MSVLVYFYLLILFFGPKYGVIDTRLLLLPIGLVLSFGYIRKSRTLNFSFMVLCILLIYSLLLYFINHFDYPDFLRYFRAIISLVALGLLFNSKIVGISRIFNGFYYVFATHAFLMLLMLLLPDQQKYIHQFFNFDIIPRHWRVTGLTAGFDIAGIITISTAVFSYKMMELTNKNRYIFLLFLSIFMTLFTSRGNMIYLALLFFIHLISYIVRNSLTKRELIFMFLFLIISISFMLSMILPIFQQTINSAYLNLSSKSNIDYISTSYSYIDPIEMMKSFIVLPESLTGLFFGISRFPYSDSGYIQTINAIGIIGLIFTFIYYFKSYFIIKSFHKKIISFDEINSASEAFLSTSTVLLLLFVFASIKNQYFFTRTVFEMFIFCSFMVEHLYAEINRADTKYSK